ncbi:hypothetical protein FGO68_gene14511 [Halteria grandinella]|uniref:Uncharacterized protein n=1 Tax=Halteria grandinella TaxID=5974 RepID=A0A8J8NYB8_HALGN|nr:hypothetical protein FGO68_gene14511 [Halteria grandinella]
MYMLTTIKTSTRISSSPDRLQYLHWSYNLFSPSTETGKSLIAGFSQLSQQFEQCNFWVDFTIFERPYVLMKVNMIQARSMMWRIHQQLEQADFLLTKPQRRAIMPADTMSGKIYSNFRIQQDCTLWSHIILLGYL